MEDIKNLNLDLTPTIILTIVLEVLYQITNIKLYRIGVWFFGIITILCIVLVFLMIILNIILNK